MGFLRKSGLFVVYLFAFILFISMCFALTLSWSLSYNNIHPAVKNVLSHVGDENGMKSNLSSGIEVMKTYCGKNHTAVIINQDQLKLTIPCNIVSQGQDAVFDYGVEQIINNFYYKDYGCSFIQCFREQTTGNLPFFLISKQTHDYWSNRFYIFLFFSIIMGILSFLLAEKKTSQPITIGFLLCVASLPFAKIEAFLSSWQAYKEFADIILVFVSKSNTVFWIMFIIGLFFIALGFAGKFFKVDEKWFGNGEKN